MDRGGDASLVGAELLELGGEEVGFDGGGALAVENEEVRDVVGLDLSGEQR